MRYDTAVPIGSGGMGEVFKAWDPNLERFVALKILRHVGPETVERLLREARIQAHVEHPGVCKVYEVGEEDGRPFIAMEYVEGPLLSEAATTLTLEQKVLVMHQVADAVQAAHAAGLVHRDIKPSNIILRSNGSGGLRPYVLDFGLAREQKVAGLTVTGQVLGTPGYLSPEQARGEVNTLDRRTDVFSLGVVLYELLGGVLPFPGDSAVEILMQLLQKEPRPLRQIAPQTPIELETVVMKCLEKDPDRRYSSAREVADDLGHFLAGEPVRARPVGRIRRIGRLVRLHRVAAAAIAISFVALSVASFATLRSRWTSRETALAAQRFGQEVEQIESHLHRAYLTPLHDLRPEIEKVEERMRWIEEETERVGEPAHAIGHYALGRGYLALGKTKNAKEHLEKAWNSGYDEPQTAYALGLALSRLYRDELEHIATIRSAELRKTSRHRAEQELRAPAAFYLSSARVGASHPEYVAASLAFFEGDSDAALVELASARESEPWFYEAELLAGDIHADRYRADVTSGRKETAQEAFERSRDAYLAATVVGRSDPRGYQGLCVLWSEALRHRFYSLQGDLESVRDSALASCQKALVANPDLPTPYLQMGRTHRYWADQQVERKREPFEALEAARANLKRSLELGPKDPETYVLLGVTYRVEGNWRAEHGEDPLPILRRALKNYEIAASIAPDFTRAHLSRSAAELHFGDYLRRHGGDPESHFEKAIVAGRRTLELEPKLVGGHVNLGIAYEQLAIHRRDRGEEAESLFDSGAAELRRAMEINPEFYTAHFNLGELLVERAELARSLGHDPSAFVGESTPLLEKAISVWPEWAPPYFLRARGQNLLSRWSISREEDPSATLEEGWRRASEGIAIGADPVGLVISARLRLVEASWQVAQGQNPRLSLVDARGLLDRAVAADSRMSEAHQARAESHWLEGEWLRIRGEDPMRSLQSGVEETGLAEELDPGDTATRLIASRLQASWAQWMQEQGEDTSDRIAASKSSLEAVLSVHPNLPEAREVERKLAELETRATLR